MQLHTLAPLLALLLAAAGAPQVSAAELKECQPVTGSITYLDLRPLAYDGNVFTPDVFFQEFSKYTIEDSLYRAQVVSGPSGREFTLQHMYTGAKDIAQIPATAIVQINSKEKDLYYWLGRDSACRGQLGMDYKDILKVQAYSLGGGGDA
jgi:hypothetical protein